MLPPLAAPLRITSPYGPRTHPVTGEIGKHHNGVDLAASQGSPVFAVSGGYIHGIDTVGDGPGGYWVRICHGAAPGENEILWSTYCHLSSIFQLGSGHIGEGLIIGLSGGTPGTRGAGRSTGAHLHFSLWCGNGARVDFDPAPWLAPWIASEPSRE